MIKRKLKLIIVVSEDRSFWSHRLSLAQSAIDSNDMFLSLLIENQMRDSERSRHWSSALVKFAITNENNRSVIEGWIEKWMVLGREAAIQYCKALPTCKERSRDEMAAHVIGIVENYHREMGLTGK